MSCRDITLPGHLLAFIDRHVPGVNGAARVKVRACEPGKWPLSAGQSGITYLGAIHIDQSLCRPDRGEYPVKLLLHEFVHIEQEERWPGLFYPWYGLEFLFRLAVKRHALEAYRAIRFEEEAYRRSDELFDAWLRENPGASA